MSGIDWEKYAQFCEDSYAPAIERFAGTLRTAASVATKLSTPVYVGAMKANLVTVLRTTIDILKQMSEAQPDEANRKKIRWKTVEDRMRETWLDRLCGIESLLIVRDYRSTRIQNRSSDLEGLYLWINSLQGKEELISLTVRRICEETALFTRNDVPQIMELARFGALTPR